MHTSDTDMHQCFYFILMYQLICIMTYSSHNLAVSHDLKSNFAVTILWGQVINVSLYLHEINMIT